MAFRNEASGARMRGRLRAALSGLRGMVRGQCSSDVISSFGNRHECIGVHRDDFVIAGPRAHTGHFRANVQEWYDVSDRRCWGAVMATTGRWAASSLG